MQIIEREIAKARQSLLDLTMRNRLLNYRQSKVRSIRITGELAAEVYEALVLRERTLEFRGTGPRINQRSLIQDVQEDSTLDELTDQISSDWSPATGETLQSHHLDRFLQTPYDNESLAKKLFHVYHEGKTVIEEQGYSVVHLALGFLEWFETTESNQARLAPLILVPVELERVSAGEFSKLKWTGEDVYGNVSLTAKLIEQGVTLPPFEMPEDKSGVDAYLEAVRFSVARFPNWRIVGDMALDFFSFTKFVMFKDLDSAAWPEEQKPEQQPILVSLFDPQPNSNEDDGFREEDIDAKLKAKDMYHVMDADPSQIVVIEDVKASRNLVVQGPPGTGKSQTITNIIGEAIGAGKRVLFVSEKMAALDVVKKRLDTAGLGPFCLELHSRKTNKKAFLEELKRSLTSTPPAAPGDAGFEEHERLKCELNLYASDLRTPVGRVGFTPYRLFGMKQFAMTALASSGKELPRPPQFSDVDRWSANDLSIAEEAIRGLSSALTLVHPVSSHQWKASRLARMLPHEENEIEEQVIRTGDSLQALREAADNLCDFSGVFCPACLRDVEHSLRAASLLSRMSGPTERALLLSEAWNAPNPAAELLIRRVEIFQRERGDLFKKLKPEALQETDSEELHEFRALAARFFRIFSKRYRALRKEFRGLYSTPAPRLTQMLSDLSRLVHYRRERDALEADPKAPELFGSRWKAGTSNPNELRGFADWMIEFRREVLGLALSDRTIEILVSVVDRQKVQSAIDRLRAAKDDFNRKISALLIRLQIGAPDALGDDTLEAPFEKVEGVLRRWSASTGDLFRWAQYNIARESVRGTIAAPILSLVNSDSIAPDQLLHVARAWHADALLRLTFIERPSLGGFVGELYEQKVARFRELDRSLKELNRARLSRKLHDARPRLPSGASRNSEAGMVLGEFNRRRGHMPIRKLLNVASGLIQRIKPCFLMSPLSVAQFLDPRIAKFDLVIFDEASQVRPEDALGAMLRGNQLVVMGDTQQLPPTSFFDHLIEEDVEEDDASEPQAASVRDVESILHQCARSFPTKVLSWHYRSHHESLIAVSNLFFYDNRLLIFPSAIEASPDLGLQFVHLPNSVYDRGKSSTNRVEAQAVVAAAFEHYRKFPGRSLGIGTFNIKQQQTILEEVEIALSNAPDMEVYFKGDRHEPFFVKNLETIQGDERDVIFISVGFGRDANGKLSMNFGPVNRDGGERRLNVIISRARERCVVFSNFTHRDLAIEATSGRGLQALKMFLQYAESRHLLGEESVAPDTDSPFEDAVKQVLESHQWEVRQQVGCAGFRVDLAVVDPDHRGEYLLGIECDGAKYHCSTVARDRDRLRQQILEENFGWKIHRIWSTDWYRNRRETIDRLLNAVDRARSDRIGRKNGALIARREEVRSNVTPTVHAPLNFTVGSVHDDVPEYQTCKQLRIRIGGDLHLVPAEQLAEAVEDVVRVEGPVHVEEVVRRIRSLWGLQRAGNRIYDAVSAGIRVAVRQKKVEENGGFLQISGSSTRARRRTGDPPANIDYICDAEVARAVEHVLSTQFATARKDLILQTCRVLGIQATSAQTAARVQQVIDALSRNGQITASPSGDVRLASN